MKPPDHALPLCVALAVAAGSAAAAEMPRQLMCATIEAMDCEPGGACVRGRPAEIGAPGFMRVDLDRKVIAGPHRTTPIQLMETSADNAQLLLQGTEIGYGWSLAIDVPAGSMAATLVNREGAFVLFGACTGL